MCLYFIFCRKKHKTSWQIDVLLRFLYREIFHENDCCGRFSRSHVSKMWEAQPTIDSFEFSSQKNGAENSSYILALFFIKTDLINKGQKGGHPIYCYYPFWGHLELEFFDDFWLKAQKLLMELCMKIKMRKSLYQFHCKQNASSWDKHSTKPWCLIEVNIRLFYFWRIILPILKKGLSKWFLGLLYKIILF